jgi:hypothetical protein
MWLFLCSAVCENRDAEYFYWREESAGPLMHACVVQQSCVDLVSRASLRITGTGTVLRVAGAQMDLGAVVTVMRLASGGFELYTRHPDQAALEFIWRPKISYDIRN